MLLCRSSSSNVWRNFLPDLRVHFTSGNMNREWECVLLRRENKHPRTPVCAGMTSGQAAAASITAPAVQTRATGLNDKKKKITTGPEPARTSPNTKGGGHESIKAARESAFLSLHLMKSITGPGRSPHPAPLQTHNQTLDRSGSKLNRFRLRSDAKPKTLNLRVGVRGAAGGAAGSSASVAAFSCCCSTSVSTRARSRARGDITS